METVRTFIAITPPPDVTEALAEMTNALRQPHDGVTWVTPANVHVTLRFLGSVATNRLPAVFDAVVAACSQIPVFRLKTGVTGTFPAVQHPRVFWLGIDRDSAEPLIALKETLETELAAAGFPKENRTFRAHLTLGRVKRGRDASEAAQRIRKYPFTKREFPVTGVAVIKSVLTRSGAVYSVQKACALSHHP